MSFVQDWEATAKVTLEKRSLKEIFWLLLGSDELFSAWKGMCTDWISGILMDGHGEANEVARDPNKLTPALFRCFEGEISEHCILKIISSVREGKAFLKKDASSQSALPSMEELAKTEKVMGVLKEVILDFYIQNFKEKFTSTDTWVDVESRLGFDEAELQRIRRACPDSFISAYVARNVAKPPTPAALRSRLTNIFFKTYGGSERIRQEPYKVFYTDNLCATLDPPQLNEAPPCAPLAFVDFSRRNTRVYLGVEVEVLLKYAVDLGQNEVTVVIFFITLGPQVKHVYDTLEKLKATMSIHVEHGHYERHGVYTAPGLYFKNTNDIIMFVGLSYDTMTSQQWKKVFVSGTSEPLDASFCFESQYDLDFLEAGYKKSAAPNESEKAKELRQKKEWLVTLKSRNPRFSFCGMAGGLVNPDAKPRRVYKDLIRMFSNSVDTVMDFFSGGAVLKSALETQRECFCYVDRMKEVEFLLLYPGHLREITNIGVFWDNVVDIHKGKKPRPKDNAADDLSSSQAEGETLPDIVLAKEVLANILLGGGGERIEIAGNPADADFELDAFLPDEPNTGLNVDDTVAHARDTGEPILGDCPLDFVNLESDGEDGEIRTTPQRVLDTLLDRRGDEVEERGGVESDLAPVVVDGQDVLKEGQSMQTATLVQPQESGDIAVPPSENAGDEAGPSGAGPSGEANASTALDVLAQVGVASTVAETGALSSDQHILNKIEKFYDRRTSVYPIGSRSKTLKHTFIGYVYAKGPHKGKPVGQKVVENYMKLPGADSTLYTPKYKATWVQNSDCLEIQNSLERKSIFEHGSFVFDSSSDDESLSLLTTARKD